MRRSVRLRLPGSEQAIPVREEHAEVAVTVRVVMQMILETDRGRHDLDRQHDDAQRPLHDAGFAQAAVRDGDAEHVDGRRVTDRDDVVATGGEHERAEADRERDARVQRVVP